MCEVKRLSILQIATPSPLNLEIMYEAIMNNVAKDEKEDINARSPVQTPVPIFHPENTTRPSPPAQSAQSPGTQSNCHTPAAAASSPSVPQSH